MKDAKFFEFRGSGLIQAISFLSVSALKFFEIWNDSWPVVLIVAFIASAVITGTISSLLRP